MIRLFIAEDRYRYGYANKRNQRSALRSAAIYLSKLELSCYDLTIFPKLDNIVNRCFRMESSHRADDNKCDEYVVAVSHRSIQRLEWVTTKKRPNLMLHLSSRHRVLHKYTPVPPVSRSPITRHAGLLSENRRIEAGCGIDSLRGWRYR